MVFNRLILFSVARFSAEAWQCLTCTQDPFTNEELFHLFFTFPFQQLRPIALCLWNFCLHHPYDSLFSYLPFSDDDVSSVATFDYEDHYNHSHSD
ncbi:unnamed protein product [Lupinus luteus]|uniref:Uncharacterized protein n=1 Tax=Lupinus luteus TaxID=3873 RepID=A0AAV1YAA2_LUPLU